MTIAPTKPHGNAAKPGDPPTARQAEILAWLIGRTIEDFYQPTFREAMAHFGLASLNSINMYRRYWIKKGLVAQHGFGISRGVGIIPTAEQRLLMDARCLAADAEPTPKLTAKQLAIFNWLVTRARLDFRQPSVREAMDHFEIGSPNGFYCHLRALERKGLITLGNRDMSRAIIFHRRVPIGAAGAEGGRG